MHKKALNFIKSIPSHIWILLLIILVGTFFRAYNFHDWMSFNSDGVRDAVRVSHAVEEGVGSLPLLGPRAGGTQLHLGPIFYYMEYLSGAIFQSTSPMVFAFPTLLFSILSIPLFFFLLREYFSPKMSLVLTAMFATSYMAIEYGRFAWNPNSTPFFSMLFYLALLKAYKYGEKNSWKKYAWFAISGSSLAIASQLHYSAFLGLPIIFAIFVALNWKDTKKISLWKAGLAFFGAILIFYIPVLVFEFLTHGKNTIQFIKAIASKGEDKDIFEKIFKDIKNYAKYFLWIAGGVVDGRLWQKALSALMIFAGVASNYFLLKRETDEGKKRFLQFSLIFLLVYFVLYIPLAFEIRRSRFFLPLLTTPFMLIGYLIVYAIKMGFRKKFKIGAAILISLLILGNVKMTLAWFMNMGSSEKNEQASDYWKVSEKNKEFWWTLGRIEKAADYMAETCKKDSVLFIISRKTKDFGDAIGYSFLWKAPGKDITEKEKHSEKYEKYDSCFYYVSLTQEDLPEFLNDREYEEPIIMGDMRIIKWYPENEGTVDFSEMKNNKNNNDRDDSLEKKINSDYPRINWGDLFR